MGRNGNSKENAVNLRSKVIASLRWDEPDGWKGMHYAGASHWCMIPHAMVGCSHWPSQCHHQNSSSSPRRCVMSVHWVLQSCCRLFFRTRSASKAGPSARLSQKEGGRWVPTHSYPLEMLLLETSGAQEGLL